MYWIYIIDSNNAVRCTQFCFHTTFTKAVSSYLRLTLKKQATLNQIKVITNFECK